MAQEPQVVVEEQPDVIQTVFEHCYTLHPHAEGKALYFFRVVVDKAEDRQRFREAMDKIGLESPKSRQVTSLDEAFEALEEVGRVAGVGGCAGAG